MQVVLLLLAAVCVPWLLIMKPYFVWKGMQKTQKQGYISLGDMDGVSRVSADDVLDGEEEGNGRATTENGDEEHVSLLFVMSWSVVC